MDEDKYIEEALESFEALNEYTEPMIEAMTAWIKDSSLEWFLAHWPEIVRKDRFLSEIEEATIAPWIQTWAEEAAKRIEKEMKQ